MREILLNDDVLSASKYLIKNYPKDLEKTYIDTDFLFILNGHYDDIRVIATIMSTMLDINIIDIDDMFRIQAYQFRLEDNSYYLEQLKKLTLKCIDIRDIINSNRINTKLNIALNIPETQFYKYKKKESIKTLWIRDNNNDYDYKKYNHIALIPNLESIIPKILELIRIYRQ